MATETQTPEQSEAAGRAASAVERLVMREFEWCDARHEIPLELADCDLLRTDDVLCIMDDGTMTVCWYDIEDDLWVEAWGERAVALASGKHVTHWAYLPDGPSCHVYGKGERRANCRLIAAAPELLTALEGMLSFGTVEDDDRIPYVTMQVDRETIAAARLAVAKALDAA